MSVAPTGFGCENGAKLAPKWDQKSISALKAENKLNACQLSGVEVGTKNRAKTDPKMESRWNASWHRFLNDVGGFWAKINPNMPIFHLFFSF